MNCIDRCFFELSGIIPNYSIEHLKDFIGNNIQDQGFFILAVCLIIIYEWC